MHKKLTLRVIGFLSSLLLTMIAYFVIISPGLFYLKKEWAVFTIFVLALFQSTLQLIFFIDIWKEAGPRWNLGVFISTILIILIIVIFSIWIMHHLNYNMMVHG